MSWQRGAAWGVAVAAAGAVMWLAWPGEAAAPADAGVTPVTAAPIAASTRPATTARVGDGEAGAPTDASQLFDIGFAGGLKVDLDTRASLDMLLAELGGNPAPQEVARVERELRKGLPADAAERALRLLRSYRAYSDAVARASATQKPPANADELRQLLARDAALRRVHFDADTARGLFGVQEAYSLYSLDLQAIEADTGLGALDKARRIQALRAALPPELLALEPSLSPEAAELDVRVATMREQGATDAQVHAVRKASMGQEAADEMGRADADTARWHERYQAFVKQRDAMLATTPATEAPALVERLLAQHFSAEELPGVRARARLPAP